MFPARRPILLPTLALFSLALGCHSQSNPAPANAPLNAGAVAAELRTIAASSPAQALYASVSDAPVWVSNGQPTPQAIAVIQELENSQQK